MAKIWVAGEALVDFFPVPGCKDLCFLAKPGGSPYNVAIGLARLQVPVAYLSVLSSDFFGDLLLQRLQEHGVETKFVTRTSCPTALAFVLKRGRESDFAFYGHNTADTQLDPSRIPAQMPSEAEALHLGSLAMARPLSNKTLFNLMQRESSRLLVSFDPNVRPQLMNLEQYRAFFNELLPYIDILKLSSIDYEYLTHSDISTYIMKRWLNSGPQIILITYGKEGAKAFTKSFHVEVAGRPIDVIDPTGAGDAFMSAFLAALYHVFGRLKKSILSQIDQAILYNSVFFSVRAAEITCTRIGADPPWLHELDEYRFWE